MDADQWKQYAHTLFEDWGGGVCKTQGQYTFNEEWGSIRHQVWPICFKFTRPELNPQLNDSDLFGFVIKSLIFIVSSWTICVNIFYRSISWNKAFFSRNLQTYQIWLWNADKIMHKTAGMGTVNCSGLMFLFVLNDYSVNEKLIINFQIFFILLWINSIFRTVIKYTFTCTCNMFGNRMQYNIADQIYIIYSSV